MSDLPPNGHTEETMFDSLSEQNNGLRAYQILGEFLQKDDWYPQAIEERYIYRVYYSGTHGEMRCYAQIRVDLEQFIFYAVAPIKVPAEMRSSVAEFLARANYGLRIGNFEMDFEDGEIRYKSSLDFEGEALSPNYIRNAIYPAVQTLDHYLPGLMAVVYGSKTAVEAIRDIEGHTTAD